jgi:hypothetical protein
LAIDQALMSANFDSELQVVEKRWRLGSFLRPGRGQAGHQDHDDRAAA